jgi:hypothetical protein
MPKGSYAAPVIGAAGLSCLRCWNQSISGLEHLLPHPGSGDGTAGIDRYLSAIESRAWKRSNRCHRNRSTK